MVILKKFRGLGIGEEALLRFTNSLNTRDYLIGEVKTENTASNRICRKVGKQLIIGESNFYLFPKRRYKEILEKNKADLISLKKSLKDGAISKKEMLAGMYSSKRLRLENKIAE